MSSEIDILLQKLSEESDPLSKVNILNSLSEEHFNSDTAQAHKYALEALSISEKINDLTALTTSRLNIAQYYYLISNYETSLKKCNEIVNDVAKLNDMVLFEKLNRILGLNFYRLGDFDQALVHHYKSLELKGKDNSTFGFARTLNNIGNVYLELEEYDSAIEYYNRAQENYRSAGNEKGELIAQSNIARAYSHLKKYPEAITMLNDVIERETQRKNYHAVASSLSHLGELYLNEKKTGEAGKAINKALEFNNKDGLKWIEIECLINLGRLAKEEKKLEIAILYLSNALSLAEKIKSKPFIYAIHEFLSEIHEGLSDTQNAFYHYKKYKEIKEDVYNQKKNLTVTLLKTKNLEKEKEIEQLKNVELKKAYDEIDKKNEEINASINYASRIQSAIFPAREKVFAVFQKGVFCFSPKDVLSGDFFWVSKFGDKTLLAVVDCTGHGIPGALLTITGNEMLNNAIDTLGIYQPGAMLNYLNKTIRKKFESSRTYNNTPINDGMDIALCSFDFKNNLLEYAGANRPLYIIRNGTLIETPPTKASIGGYTPIEQIFKNHIIPLQKGDMVYVFSDGYVDQFGMPAENWKKSKGSKTNEKNPELKLKKFMTKNFKELLTKNFDLPVNEQQKIIMETLDKWKDAEEQTDDITVIGIQI